MPSEATTLLEELDRLGVSLSVEADRLYFDAPAGVMTEAFKNAIAANKSEIVALVSGRCSQHQPWPPRDPRLAGWSVADRQRWGDATAKLEDAGMDWREAERKAFLHILREKQSTATTVDPDRRRGDRTNNSQETAHGDPQYQLR